MYFNDYRLNIVLVTFDLILFWAVLFSPNVYVSAAVIIIDMIGAIVGYLYINKDNE